MGGIKRMIEEQEQKRKIAISIALEAGVLHECQSHSDSIFCGDRDIEDAYKLGNYKFSNNEFSGVFRDRREMTDMIKEVVETNSGMEECSLCAKIRDE